jgi:hypothetical protein
MCKKVQHQLFFIKLYTNVNDFFSLIQILNQSIKVTKQQQFYNIAFLKYLTNKPIGLLKIILGV